jgi:hypothetical protein
VARAERERERERERGYAKWDREVSAGVDGAQKELGCVGGRRGRGSWRTCVSARVLVHGGPGKAELTGGVPRRSERESGRAGITARCLAKRARKAERERNAQARATGADNLAPLGRERERVSARGREPPLIGGAHLSGGTGARPG